MHAYHITGNTSDRAELNISPARAAELTEQGWYLSETTIVWATNEYVDGKVVPIVITEPVVVEQPLIQVNEYPTWNEPYMSFGNDSFVNFGNDSM